MWPCFCPDCGRHVLVDCRRIVSVETLAPGVIAVEVTCPDGHRVQLLTGRGTDPPVRPRPADEPGPRPAGPIRRALRAQQQLWDRYAGW